MNKHLRALMLIVLCLPASLLLSGWFVPRGTWRWLAAGAAVIPIAPALLFRLARRDERRHREQGVYLFQVLLARLAIGEPLARAVVTTSHHAAQVWGPRTAFTVALRDLAGALEHQAAFPAAIARFATRFSCREAAPILTALARIQPLGAGIDTLLRMGREIVAEAITVADAVAAEAAQRNAEALAVAAMPPVIVLLLGKLAPAYLAPMYITSAGAAVMALLYFFSILSLALVVRVVADPRPKHRTGRSYTDTAPSHGEHNQAKERQGWMGQRVSSRMVAYTPAAYRARLQRQLEQVAPFDNAALAHHLVAKAGWAMAGAAIGLFFTSAAAASPLWIAGGLIALPLLQDYDLRRRVERARDHLLARFPIFLGMLTAVLHTGLPLGGALDVCLAALPPDRDPLTRALAQIRAATRGGQTAAPGFERLAARVDLPEIQAALSLIAQYERAGGAQHLSLLRLQIPICRTLYRNTIRRRTEHQMARLLLPMFLSLLLVILITGLPAVIGLQA